MPTPEKKIRRKQPFQRSLDAGIRSKKLKMNKRTRESYEPVR